MICFFFFSLDSIDVKSNVTEDGINVTQVLLQQENEQLKRRTEQLNNRIQTLIRDKERLLEISNHLKSQLHRHEGGKHFSSEERNLFVFQMNQ